MSSLSEIADLVGFFSYSRQDDANSDGALSRLRGRIQKELRLQLGRDFRLWQDMAAIPFGTLWEDEIRRAIAESVFFIPIVTPSAVNSPHCRREFEMFLAREAELGRSDLIFPILYIRVAALEKELEGSQSAALRIIRARQYIDWQQFRHLDAASSEVGIKVEQFCSNIAAALHRAWISLEERRQRDEAEARRREEDLRRTRDAEAKQKEEERALQEQDARLRKAALERPKARAEKDASDSDGAREQGWKPGPAADVEAAGARPAAPPELSGASHANSTMGPSDRETHEAGPIPGAVVEQARTLSPALEFKSRAWSGVPRLLSDGRARFLVGTALLMNAALWGIAIALSTATEAFGLSVAILIGVLSCIVALATMRGIRGARLPAIVLLSLSCLAAAAAAYILVAETDPYTFFIPALVSTLVAVAACLTGIFVCLRGWERSSQAPMVTPRMDAMQLAIWFWFLVCPFWASYCFFVSVRYSFLTVVQLLGLSSVIFVVGCLFAFLRFKKWTIGPTALQPSAD